MATAVQFRDFATAKEGYRYEVGPTRTTGADGYFDCSGLVTYAAHQCGLSIPTISATQARYCHDRGTDRIAIDEALRIPGALMFKGDNLGMDGWGSGGHVAISMGDGANVIEAKGHAWGVLIDPSVNGSHPWTNAARLPGLDYGGAHPVTAPEPPDPKAEADVAWKLVHHPRSNRPTPGYWAVSPDGRVYSYGIAKYHGGQGARMKAGRVDPTGQPVTLNGSCDSFTPTPSGEGYLMITSAGSVYAFGDAQKLGDPYGDPLT